MRAMFLVLTAVSAAVTAQTAGAQAPVSPGSGAIPEVAPQLPQTPVEISAVKENGLFRLRTTKTSLALYTFDQDSEDRSACSGACVSAWPPVIARSDSVALGEWKPIRRDDGRLQWTFRGRPVYSYQRDTPIQTAGDGAAGQWHLVQPITWAPPSAPTPVNSAVAGAAPAIPVGVGIGKSRDGTPIFTDLHGYAVYAFDRDPRGSSACNSACAAAWPPLAPPAGAVAVGDWTIVKRGDGSSQWAYKGRPAYIHAQDKPNGGETGHGRDGTWHLIGF